LIVTRARWTSSTSRSACFAALALLAVAPGSAAASSSMAIQPDGKIVLASEAWPGFAAVTRLNADGSLDESFGDHGTAIDRRLPSLLVVAVQPDGRILAASKHQLVRYLPNGQPDPTFGEGGIAGDPIPLRRRKQYWMDRPEFILALPDGRFFLAGARTLNYPEGEGIVRLYDSDGSLVEIVGFVPETGPPPLLDSVLKGLVLEDDGSLIAAGSASPRNGGGPVPLFGRFVPGSGSAYDTSFGSGGNLALATPFKWAEGSALARDADGLVLAGTAEGTFMLARFDSEGLPDPAFGDQGFAAPPIVGTSGGPGTSEAQAIAVDGAGRLVAAGGTTKWGNFHQRRGSIEPTCERCLEPLVARYTSDGDLDTSFGADGLARLIVPEGTSLYGENSEAEQVAVLPGGKILVKGFTKLTGSSLQVPILARLNPDGSLDTSFGEDGLERLQLPCMEKDLARLRRDGCIAAARVRLRVRGLSRGRPSLSLRVRPSLPWARIATVRMRLPRALSMVFGLPGRVRVLAIGGAKGRSSDAGQRRYFGATPVERRPGVVAFNNLGQPRVLDVQVRRGALHQVRRALGRRLAFHITVRFRYEGARAGRQALIIRKGI
jgi:uncharacterized delta-60 repeat protein